MEHDFQLWYKEEAQKLDMLRLDHARLDSKVDFLEKEVIESKRSSESRFAKLESKLDELAESVQNIRGDVKEVIAKIGIGTVVVIFVAQIIAKHFGIL